MIVYNIYCDGKYLKLLLTYKKYYKIGFIIFMAFCFYLMLKRNPNQTKNMLLYTNNMVKYLPIDKASMDLISPIFDLSTNNNNNNNNTLYSSQQSFQPFMQNLNNEINPGYNFQPILSKQLQHQYKQQYQQHQQQMNQINKQQKRSVSETKKKYVASNQDWKCGQCRQKLTHTFEIDHRVRLEYGGTNDVTNLVALCRECHGNKTAMENM